MLGINWSKKLLSIATDEAANITGRHPEVVMRFEQITSPKLFGIWCSAHQLDLAVQHVMCNVINQSFRYSLVFLIGYLRRQVNLRAEMDTTCSVLSGTLWISLENCTLRLLKHQNSIEEYLDEKSLDMSPDASWWVLLTCIKNFMEPVHVFSRQSEAETLSFWI